MNAPTHSRTFVLNGNLQEAPMLPALRLVQSSRIARRIAKTLVVLLVLSLAAMIYVPWQQTVTGSGRVVAFTPLERRQSVKATISGRVKSWAKDIQEGTFVRKDDVVLELEDNDPLLRDRQKAMVELLETKIENTEEKVRQYEGYAAAFGDARTSTIEAAKELVTEAEKDLEAKRRDLAAARAAASQKKANYERQQALFDKGGLTSKYKVEVAERESAEAEQKVKAAESYVEGAEAKVRSKEADLEKKDREAAAKVASAEADLATARGDLAGYRKELAEAESKRDKLDRFTVRAPKDGYVLNLAAFQGGEYVKPGDPLFTLVPEVGRMAVEVWVDGNDVPLVEQGRHVRLQFEGWPAVQFSGWPSVAVGTFGGTVSTVDSTDDGKGRFRVLVVPDGETPWPQTTYLRQGARTNAWVLLETVPLGYEVWRRLNGFPASVAMDKEKGDKPAKPPKPKS